MPIGRERALCQAVFDAVPSPCLLLDTHLVILDANPAYLGTVGRGRDDLLGRSVWEALPEQGSSKGTDALGRSLQGALRPGRPDRLPLVRYDVETEPGPVSSSRAGGAWSTSPSPAPMAPSPPCSTPSRT